MVNDERRSSQGILKSLTRLDLYVQSLRLVGEKLVLAAQEPASVEQDDLLEKSVQLGGDCLELMRSLEHQLETSDIPLWESAVGRADLAVRRAARARTATLVLVNLWRVVEATDELLSSIARQYGYTRLEGDPELDASGGEETKRSDLAELFEEYGNAMAARTGAAGAPEPPFRFGVLRWRGSQLFYVERVEDGARWVELDPDHEAQSLGQEPDDSESVRARTIEGHEVELRLDLETDEHEVDEYFRSQQGSEYYVSGYQFVTERGLNRRQQKRRG